MQDDKTKTDIRDRSRVFARDEYEIEYLKDHYGVTRDQARELVRRYGNDRDLLMKHARNLR